MHVNLDCGVPISPEQTAKSIGNASTRRMGADDMMPLQHTYLTAHLLRLSRRGIGTPETAPGQMKGAGSQQALCTAQRATFTDSST